MERMTRQRRAVLAELERRDEFRSAQQVHDDLAAQGQRVGLATVYRNLQALADERRIDVLRSTDGEALYRHCRTVAHHHHLVCRQCGLTEEIGVDAVESWVADVAVSHAFTAVQHSIELSGLCARCSASR